MYEYSQKKITRFTNAFIVSLCFYSCAFLLLLILAFVSVGRHYARASCERRDEASSAEYKWLDYHYFSYECLLVTSSGNITGQDVLPLEDLTNR